MYGPMRAPTPREREAVPAEDGAEGSAPAPVARDGNRPHICFVAPTTWPLFSGDRSIPVVGGAEVQQSVIAPALAERGYRVSMITLDYGQPERAVVKGVTVYRMHRPDEGVPVVRFLHPRLTSLWRALRRVDADIYYHRTSAATTGFLAQFCRNNGKRAIYAAASDVDFMPGRQDITFARDRWLFEYGVRHVDRVFAQNEAQRESLLRHYGRESVVIPNCYRAPHGAHADRRGYVLWVATVRHQKRPELLVEIARRMPQYRFVMVGGTDPDRRSRELAAAMRVAAAGLPNLDYRGFVPFADADRLFDGARVALNTSLYEGFPNTFLQAWARGVPTIGFVDTGSGQRGGQPVYDIVGDVGAACARLDRLMRDDLAWREASHRAAAHFRERHSVEAVVGLYERELLALHGAA